MTAVAAAEQGRSQDSRAYVVLGVGILCIAWSAILVKVASDVSGPASAFYRVFIACAVLIPLWAVKSRGKPLPEWQTIGLAALGGVFFAFDLALFSSAILITSATSTTLIANSTPIWVALGSWLIWKELPSISFWIGLGVILVGMTALVGGDVLHHTALGYGHLMAVASSAWYAAYLMTTHRVRVTSDTLTFTVISVAASAVTLWVVCLLSGVPMSGFAPRSWAALVTLGLVSQVGGYLAITYALGHLRATVTSVSLLAQAPLTALLAMPLLGERLSPAQAVGGALVLGGVYVVNRRAA
ncbi:MAG TPA: DMT family transporter [Gemmatimonadaceae bacterium]|nr:DMT family transporter [Gemmatimonadaceae bacterium]